jgi:choline dehydrogenase
MYSADPRHNFSSNPGVTQQVFARKEVIVSGGTFNSPQLLLLSGIGPKADLQSLDIPVVVDLPGVGTNLQDNPEMAVSATSSQNFTSIGPSCTITGDASDPCMAPWYAGEGQYTQGPLGAIFFKSTQAALNERDIMMFPLAGGSFEGYWPGQTVNTIPQAPLTNFDFSMAKIHPRQNHVGTLKLASSNPRDTPLINFRFFEDTDAEKDLEAFAEAVEWGRSVFASLEESNLGPFTESLPCDGNQSCDVKAYVKAQAWSHHATSTCSIGADDDPLAVLDSKFRVRGTIGLRVVDASAFPRPPGPYPVLPTFVLGMKGSAAVLEDKDIWQ